VKNLQTTVAWALFAPLAAFAQTAARPDPADPRLRTPPPPAADSAFAGYRSYRDEPMAPWREVNDEVGRVGGHVGILKEEERAANKTQPAGAGAAPAPARADAPGGKKHAH